MRSRRDAAGPLGLGAVACAACCVGPALGSLGAVGLGAVLAVAGGSLLAIGVLALVAVPLLARRQPRRSRPAGPVLVSLGRSDA